MPMYVTLDTELHNRLRMTAKAKGRTMRSIAREAVKAYVEREELKGDTGIRSSRDIGPE